jgi:hypothetical protein
MRKLLALFVILVAFTWCQTVYGIFQVRTLVYKGTIKASKSIFDVNDTNNLVSGTIQGYWAVTIRVSGSDRGSVYDSNAVVYDAKNKFYKVIPDSMSIDPCDPCRVTLLRFEATDAEGQVWFNVVGKGKLTKYSGNTGAAKDFIPTSLKGMGFMNNYDFFDPNYTFSGPTAVTLTLDSKWTIYANTGPYDYENIINDIVAGLTSKGGWTNWPNNPAER